MKKTSRPVWKHSADTRQGRIERAVFVLNDPCKMDMGTRLAYLTQKGLSGSEITEAINTASGGVLVQTALGAP